MGLLGVMWLSTSVLTLSSGRITLAVAFLVLAVICTAANVTMNLYAV